MKIIIFESAIDSLKAFARLMADGFREIGFEVLLTDMQREQVLDEVTAFADAGGVTSALFFNHAGLNLITEERESIWNLLDVDCYDFIVDHPMYYHAAIMFPIRRLTFLCVDQYHQKFIERFYPGRVRSFFLPLAGIRAEGPVVPWEDRSMEILFTGAYFVDDNVEDHIQGLSEGLKQIWLECYQMLSVQTYLTLEQAVERCFREKGIPLPEEDLRDTVRLFQDMDGILRSNARAGVVKSLVDGGVQVHVYGEGWEYLECRQENLILHGRIPFDETIPLTADAKIVLNVMPWFKAGAHDRVYTAMLNQCVCLTDSSEYMDRQLLDGKNALLYSLTHLEELPKKVKHYMEQPDKLAEIARQGYEDADGVQTWQYRAKQLADIIEGSFERF